MSDYYSVLEVDKNASVDEVKRSYRKLSLKHHPDRNGGSAESVQKFQKISEAFETLGDADKRRQYDFTLKFQGGSGSPFGQGSPFNFNAGDNGEQAEMFAKVFEDLQKQGINLNGAKMFSFTGGPSSGFPGFPGFPGFTHTQMNNFDNPHNIFDINVDANNKPAPITKKITIDMIVSILGDKIPLEYERWILENGTKKMETVKIYIDIHKGIDTNEIIMIKDSGKILNDKCKGDVKIIINVENNSIFKRQGMDLIMEKELTLKESLWGFTFEIKHLNGRSYTLTTPSGTVITPGHIKQIDNLGVMRDGKVGRLIIQFKIIYPTELNKDVVEKLKELL